MLGESIQSKYIQSKNIRIDILGIYIYVYMHSIFYDIKAKYGDIYDLGHL